MSYDLFLFAGEASGDLHGEKLLQELYALSPKLQIKGVGGPRMRSVGMECLFPMEEFEAMGFTDVLFALPKLYKKFQSLKREILKNCPKGVVSIDYPAFNLRMAKALLKGGSRSKRIHYICPKVWAWGKGRISKMEHSLDHLLTIFPFEVSLFARERLKTTYVGHPLISRIEDHQYDPHWNIDYGIQRESTILSIFPGSREKEILRNFPIQMEVARALQKKYPSLLIGVSCAQEKFSPFLKGLENIRVISPKHSYELMRASHLAIATSGTITLELALHHIPTVVTYAAHPIDIFIAQKMLRINLSYFSLPNIIYNGEIFPELFGPTLKTETLLNKAEEFMLSECLRSHCIEKCKKLKKFFGKKNASKEAAQIILNLLN